MARKRNGVRVANVKTQVPRKVAKVDNLSFLIKMRKMVFSKRHRVGHKITIHSMARMEIAQPTTVRESTYYRWTLRWLATLSSMK